MHYLVRFLPRIDRDSAFVAVFVLGYDVIKVIYRPGVEPVNDRSRIVIIGVIVLAVIRAVIVIIVVRNITRVRLIVIRLYRIGVLAVKFE